jgi:hypothetical protein
MFEMTFSLKPIIVWSSRKPGVPSLELLFGQYLSQARYGAGDLFDAEVESASTENVDVYSLMARILGLKPASNDGGCGAAKAVLRSPK